MQILSYGEWVDRQVATLAPDARITCHECEGEGVVYNCCECCGNESERDCDNCGGDGFVPASEADQDDLGEMFPRHAYHEAVFADLVAVAPLLGRDPVDVLIEHGYAPFSVVPSRVLAAVCVDVTVALAPGWPFGLRQVNTTS